MKNKLTVFVLLGTIAGFVAGLTGSSLVTPAYAAGNTVIHATSQGEIASLCNFDKTMVAWANGYLCVKK